MFVIVDDLVVAVSDLGEKLLYFTEVCAITYSKAHIYPALRQAGEVVDVAVQDR